MKINNPHYTNLVLPNIRYSDGIYLVKTTSQLLPNVIDHFGVMIVGLPLGRLGHSRDHPLVFHLTNYGFQINWLEEFGRSEVLVKVPVDQEISAIERLRFASNNLSQWDVSNNCEHFARYVTEGYKQSIQLQNAGAVAGGLALAYILLKD